MYATLTGNLLFYLVYFICRGDQRNFTNFAVNSAAKLTSRSWHEPQQSRRGSETDQPDAGGLLLETIHNLELELQSRRARARAGTFRGARK